MSQFDQNGKEAVLERLRRIIAERLDANLKLEEVAADVPISEGGLGLDSIMLVEFIVLIEEDFGFQFGEDDLTSDVFTDLNNLAAFLACRSGLPGPDRHDPRLGVQAAYAASAEGAVPTRV